MSDLDFIECDACKAKPGMAALCAGCLNNRTAIERLAGRAKKAALLLGAGRQYRDAEIAFNSVAHLGEKARVYQNAAASLLEARAVFEQIFGVGK